MTANSPRKGNLPPPYVADSPRLVSKVLKSSRDTQSKLGSHQKLSKYHYHLKTDSVYGDKKLKLCGQCIIPGNLSKDLRHLSHFVKRSHSNEDTAETARSRTNNKTSQDILNEEKLFSNDINIDLKVLDLTTERQSAVHLPLVYLPAELFRFKQLIRLHLDGNHIRTIPDLLGLNLVNLKILTLSNNLLQNLPNSFNNLNNLESLHLSSNKFEKFPEVICRIDSLKFLDLTCNELKNLSSDIHHLKYLETLLLFQNNLTRLPETIGKLTRLRTLWLGNNKLTKLPIQICDLTSLEWDSKNFDLSTNIEGNPLEEPPVEICIKGMLAIRDYFYSSNIPDVYNNNKNNSNNNYDYDDNDDDQNY